MATPTPQEIKKAMPAKLGSGPTPEQKQDYYKGIEAVGRIILNGFFATQHHDNLTARRPFSGLKTTPYYADAKKVKDNILKKDATLKGRSPEIGHAVQLACQEMWIGKASIPNSGKLTWEEKFALIGWKNEDPKKEVLIQYLSFADEKRTVKNLKGAMTRGEKKKARKAETEKEKASPKAKAEPAVVKTKPVIGKKEIDALIKQAETAEKELTTAKSDFDKAMDKVKQVHGKLKEELLLAKRIMDREG